MPEKKITKAIVCPMCGEMSKADVYTSINPSVTKGVRRRALDGEPFCVEMSVMRILRKAHISDSLQ